MANAVDELSRMIGQIQADVSHTRKNTDIINDKVDGLTEKVIRHDAIMGETQKKIAEMQPHIEDYKKTKQQGIGILSVLGMIFGAIGAVLTKVVAGIF